MGTFITPLIAFVIRLFQDIQKHNIVLQEKDSG